MRKLYFLIFILLFSCTQQPDNEVVSRKITDNKPRQVLVKPKVYPVFKDSIKTITPGKNGLALPKIVKADHSNKVLYTGPRPITPGVSHLALSKKEVSLGKKPAMSKKPIKRVFIDNSEINTPGKNGISDPKTYKLSAPVAIQFDSIPGYKEFIIRNNLFSVQSGDTIMPPFSVRVKHTLPVKGTLPSYKDNAILDVKYLQMEHGMTSTYIHPILETRNGDIWIGNYGTGISRYNGTSFSHFQNLSGSKLDLIDDMIEDRHGNIWIATRYNGVACYDGDSFTWYTTEQGLTDNWVRTIHESSDGDIWFGTANGISRYNGKEIVNYTTQQGLGSNDIRHITEDQHTNIWIGGDYLTRFDGDNFTLFPAKETFDLEYIMAVMEDTKGRLWMASAYKGVAVIDGDTITGYSSEQGFTDSFILCIYQDSKENIWFGTYEDGLYKYDGTSFTNYNMDHGLSQNWILSIMENSGGNLWLGTNGGGIILFNPNGFVTINSDHGLIKDPVARILEDSRSDIWIAGYGGGLNKFDSEYLTRYTQKEGFPHNWVIDIALDHSGNVWSVSEFGDDYGLSYFDQDSFTIYSHDQGLPDKALRSCTVDSDGNLWIGTRSDGLLKFSDATGIAEFQHYNFHPLKDLQIVALYPGHNNNIWIGTQGDGLFVLKDDRLIQIENGNGLEDNTVTAFFEDDNFDMWIATRNGVSRYDGEHMTTYKTEHGLVNNIITSALKDRNGNYWFATIVGLSLMTPNAEQFYNYGRQDGLIYTEFKNKAGLLDSKNKMRWGSGRGMKTLDLNNFKIPANQPIMKLSHVLINEKSYDYREFQNINDDSTGIRFSSVPAFENFPENLELDYTNNHLSFHFYAIDWSAPHQLKYQHIMDGQDDAWSEITDGISVTYRNLPHGNYTFKVRATGIANKWSKTLEYAFIIHPPWWHTWWARTIYGLLFILLIILIVQLRTRSLLKRQKLLQKSEEKYRGVFDSITDVFLRAEIEGNCILISPSVFDVLGYTVEEVMGKNLSMFYTNPADRDELVQKLKEKGSLQNYEVELTKKNGSIIIGSSNTRFIFDTEDNPIYIESVFRDVTDDRIAEEELKESKERYQSLSDASFEAIFISENGICIEQNALAEKMFGYTLSEAVGRKATEWIIPEDRDMVINNILSGFEKPYELTALRKDGSTFPAEIQGRMMNFKGRDVSVTALNDISRRKLAEVALVESEEKFRTLVTNTEEIIYMIDKDGTFLLSEGKGLEKLGLKGGDVVGMSVFEVYKDFPEMLDKMKLVFSGETVIMEHEVGDIYFKSWHTPHLNQEGEIIGLLGLSINITEQKKAEFQILEYQKRLKDLTIDLTLAEEKVRKQIAGDLHDNVGQLLTSSRMQLSTINDEMDKAGVSKKIKNISKALLQANQATREAIFNLSPPQLHEIGLYAAIHDWMKDQVEIKYGIKTAISGKNEKYKLDENTRLLIFRSVRELMINVTKHARAAHLDIETNSKNDMLEIMVRDDGVGFDYNSKLFRLKSKSYGLFSIQERISDLGGSMKITSTPGFGTKIKLSIPLK